MLTCSTFVYFFKLGQTNKNLKSSHSETTVKKLNLKSDVVKGIKGEGFKVFSIKKHWGKGC